MTKTNLLLTSFTVFALYSGYIKVLQNSFAPIESLMTNYIGVALLLGIFLPSNLAQLTEWICADSQAQADAQCTSTGGQCLFSPGCDDIIWVSGVFETDVTQTKTNYVLTIHTSKMEPQS